MLITTEGIVFRTVKYGETSLIVDIYSIERGLQSYIIGSVRKKKAKTSAGMIQAMNQVSFTAYDKENTRLNRIKEIRLSYYYENLIFQIGKMSLGLFMIEICRKSIREKESNPELYSFLKEWFCFVDKTQDSISNLHLLFMLELSSKLGFGPSDTWKDESSHFNLAEGIFDHLISGQSYILDSENSRMVHFLFHYEKESIHQLSISKSKRLELLYHFVDYYRLHLENFGTIKSLPILQEVMN